MPSKVPATRGQVAILGAGIMGSCLALFLARRGYDVCLFDKEDRPVACASRWNEGKIHLGYLYGADASMRTARHLIPGGLRFGGLVSQLLDCTLQSHTTSTDDIYLVHRQSVVDAEMLRRTFRNIDALLHDDPEARNYLVDVSAARAKPLSRRELAAITDADDIVAGFEVPERSVNTQWVADRFAAALQSEPRISLRMGTRVTAAKPQDGIDGRWRVVGEPQADEPFDIVINALWEGRLAVDRMAGLEPDPGWSHRYRLCVFARTGREVRLRSALIAVGPFGDVKNYNDREFYLSWYPVGLVAEGSQLTLAAPQTLNAENEQRFLRKVRENITRLMPDTAQIFDAAEDLKIRGGFVFAQAQGSLSDPRSSIHRRDRFGVRRMGNYFSVDTGKYSTAPWLAEMLSRDLSGD